MKGSLFLRAGIRDERTVLLESRGTYPLQVLRPHTEHAGGGLSLVILLLSGGLLDGDCLSMDVVVERGARLALRTQAATQIHSGRSEQRLRVTVAEDARFSYVPHAVVPHAGADYHAVTQMSLNEGAGALVADALTPGRIQFGERFAYHQVRLDLDVHRADSLIARERASIRPDAALRCAQWGNFSHVASAYMLGANEPLLCQTQSPSAGPGAGLLVGATELARDGWFIRALADRASAIDDLLAGLAAGWWTSCAI